MVRLWLVAALVALSGCASPAQPPAPVATPPSQPARPPELVHVLVLAAPPGQGSLELTREIRMQGAPTAVYRARGAIVATTDIGQWRFAYTKTSLEGAATAPVEWIMGLHALSVGMTNISSGPLEVDWNQTAFIDPAGRSQRVIHRGVQLNQLTAPMVPSTIAPGATLNDFVFPSGGISFSAPGRASTWNAPALFERLRPGGEFSLSLSIKSGDTSAPRTFRFAAIGSGPAGGGASPTRP